VVSAWYDFLPCPCVLIYLLVGEPPPFRCTSDVGLFEQHVVAARAQPEAAM
jgi:hypothetical protein